MEKAAVQTTAFRAENQFPELSMKAIWLLASCLLLVACSSPVEVEPTAEQTSTPIPETMSTTATSTLVAPTQTATASEETTVGQETVSPTTTPTSPPAATSPPEGEPLEFGGPNSIQQSNSEESPLLDFSLIEGHWVGQIIETDEKGTGSRIEIFLNSSAEQGSSVGSVRYATYGSGIVTCRGRWLAIRAEDPVYTVSEQIISGASESGSGCPDGSVRLEHDPQSGTLKYEFTHSGGNPDWNAYGTLTRSEE